MQRKYEVWVDDEVRCLELLYPVVAVSELAELMGRTPSSIRQKARSLRLRAIRLFHQPGQCSLLHNPYKSLSTTELAYIAGVLDGDGSIALKQRKAFLTIMVLITNTDFTLLEWLRSRLEGANVFVREPLGKRRVWQLYLASIRSYHLLSLLLPYLVVKRDRAEHAIKAISSSFPPDVLASSGELEQAAAMLVSIKVGRIDRACDLNLMR